MELVYVTIVLALLEYMVMGALVGFARTKYGVRAPATTGHPDFERTYRVHINTLENLVIFIPSVWIFAAYVSPRWAAVLGFAFVICRAIYAFGYMKAAESAASAPASRGSSRSCSSRVACSGLRARSSEARRLAG
jgi:glutathione S-transferase